MFRVAIAAALVASASAAKHVAKRDACIATFEASASTCDDIVALGRCFAREGISALKSEDPVRIIAENTLIVAQKAAPQCIITDDHTVAVAPKVAATEGGDLAVDVHEAHEVRMIRFKRQIVDLYSLTTEITAAEAACADDHKAKADLAALEATVASTNTTVSKAISDFKDALDGELTRFETHTTAAIAALDADIDTRKAAFDATVAQSVTSAGTGLEAKIEAEKLQIAAKLAEYLPVQSWPNATHDPAFIFHETERGQREARYTHARNYELVMAEKADSQAQNGHGGRWFYKVNFNVVNPHYFQGNREELRYACRDLSEDLKQQKCPGKTDGSVDGLDRDLRPACNHDHGRNDNGGYYCGASSDSQFSNNKNGMPGDSVFLSGSYLSDCGCDSRERNWRCVGLSRRFLTGALMYNRQHRWNGDWLLRHDGKDCQHHWVNSYGRSGPKALYTLCTSKWDDGKQNLGPLEGPGCA